jgi:hypothetical protein
MGLSIGRVSASHCSFVCGPKPREFDQMREKARQTVVAKYDMTACLRQKLAWLSGLMNARR